MVRFVVCRGVQKFFLVCRFNISATLAVLCINRIQGKTMMRYCLLARTNREDPHNCEMLPPTRLRVGLLFCVAPHTNASDSWSFLWYIFMEQPTQHWQRPTKRMARERGAAARALKRGACFKCLTFFYAAMLCGIVFASDSYLEELPR